MHHGASKNPQVCGFKTFVFPEHSLVRFRRKLLAKPMDIDPEPNRSVMAREIKFRCFNQAGYPVSWKGQRETNRTAPSKWMTVDGLEPLIVSNVPKVKITAQCWPTFLKLIQVHTQYIMCLNSKNHRKAAIVTAKYYYIPDEVLGS